MSRKTTLSAFRKLAREFIAESNLSRTWSRIKALGERARSKERRFWRFENWQYNGERHLICVVGSHPHSKAGCGTLRFPTLNLDTMELTNWA